MAKEIVKQWKDAVAKGKGKDGSSNAPKPGASFVIISPRTVDTDHLRLGGPSSEVLDTNLSNSPDNPDDPV